MKSLLIGFVHEQNISELNRIGVERRFDHVVAVPFQTQERVAAQVEQLLDSVAPFSEDPVIETVLAIDLYALDKLGVPMGEIFDIAEKVRARMKTNVFTYAMNSGDFITGEESDEYVNQTIH